MGDLNCCHTCPEDLGFAFTAEEVANWVTSIVHLMSNLKVGTSD